MRPARRADARARTTACVVPPHTLVSRRRSPRRRAQVICWKDGCWDYQTSNKFVTCAKHRDFEPSAAAKSDLARQALETAALSPEDDVRNSLPHAETAAPAAVRRTTRDCGTNSFASTAAGRAKAGRDQAARAAATSALDAASDANVCGEADGDETARHCFRTSHGQFIVSCNCRTILAAYPMERSEALGDVWAALTNLRAKCLALAADLRASSSGSLSDAIASALEQCPAGAVYDRADALVLHILRARGLEEHWKDLVFMYVRCAALPARSASSARGSARGRARALIGACGARPPTAVPAPASAASRRLDHFHAPHHSNIFNLGYTQPSDELLAKAMYSVKSTAAETNNQKLSRLKFHLNRMGHPRAQFFVQIFVDLHNEHIFQANQLLVTQAEERAAKGLGPKPVRKSLVNYVTNKVPACLPHHCWQPEEHRAAGCGAALVRTRHPVVESYTPLIVSASDGAFPTIRCRGFNSFVFDDRDSYGIVRRVVGHRYGHLVVVDDAEAPGQMVELTRDKYLVDWMPEVRREWDFTWEPAENLLGGVAARHIDGHCGRVPPVDPICKLFFKTDHLQDARH